MVGVCPQTEKSSLEMKKRDDCPVRLDEILRILMHARSLLDTGLLHRT